LDGLGLRAYAGRSIKGSNQVTWMEYFDHITNENRDYYPEAIVVFMFMMGIGCVFGVVLTLVIQSIVKGSYA
jgi:hypothetical protein